ncbi:MAG: hypothetical protein ABIW79_08935 [Gemmatimonas sp.]
MKTLTSDRSTRQMARRVALAAMTLCFGASASVQAQARSRTNTVPYYPDAGSWERRSPSSVGLDSVKLAEAIAFAITSEAKAPRDLEMNHYQSFGREPLGDPIGPIAPRGDPTGVIVRRGYVVAQWGDPTAVEMTHSVTKSFLSTIVGLAVDKGLIRSVHDTVS